MRRPLSFQRDQSGVSAVEFAIILPLMLLLFLGGFAICQIVSLSRKVTITTRALADLTTQYTNVTDATLSTITNASTQIIAPFDPTPLTLRLTEISVDATGLNAFVKWSKPVNTTAYAQDSLFNLPLQMYVPNTSYILSEVTYSYSPPVAYGLLGPFRLADKIYMVPRLASTVSYSSS